MKKLTDEQRDHLMASANDLVREDMIEHYHAFVEMGVRDDVAMFLIGCACFSHGVSVMRKLHDDNGNPNASKEKLHEMVDGMWVDVGGMPGEPDGTA